MGLYEALSEKNEVICTGKGRARDAYGSEKCEVYITSANGVSKTGELVNIDGTGNRVSQTYSDRKKYILSLETIKSVRI